MLINIAHSLPEDYTQPILAQLPTKKSIQQLAPQEWGRQKNKATREWEAIENGIPLILIDDSMTNYTDFPQRPTVEKFSTVVIDVKDKNPKDGSIVLALLNNQPILRVLNINDDGTRKLTALNDIYADLPEPFTILGRCCLRMISIEQQDLNRSTEGYLNKEAIAKRSTLRTIQTTKNR